MKNSNNADAEIALGAGVTQAALLNAGVIAEEGLVTTFIAEAGASAGLGALTSIGEGFAAVCGILGPIGWVAAGIGGAALIIHGAYRMS